MCPQRQSLVSDVTVERVKITVQSIDIEGIGGLESYAFKRNDRHHCSGIKANDGFVDVSNIGDEGFRLQLAGFGLGKSRQG
ncbi:hypothetical protein D9M72_604920 [compost metagenome]